MSFTHSPYIQLGVLSSTGETNASNGYSVDGNGNWDIRITAWSSYIGHTNHTNGWDNDGTAYNGLTMNGADVRLEYGSDGYFRYYFNDVLYYTSSNTYSGAQDLHIFTPDSYSLNVAVPSDITITTIGAGTTVPPTGFTSPLLQGEMSGTWIVTGNSYI